MRGGIVQPATPDEKAATREFLESQSDRAAWGREGWARADLAARGCVATARGG